MIIKKSIKTAIVGLLMVPALILVSMFTPVASALTPAENAQQGANATGISSKSCLFTSTTCTKGIFTTITNTALFIIGALSVLMLIYGGIRYTVSAGDSKQVEAAKNTIMYAIIGIIVALLAGAIVNFVLSSFIAA